MFVRNDFVERPRFALYILEVSAQLCGSRLGDSPTCISPQDIY